MDTHTHTHLGLAVTAPAALSLRMSKFLISSIFLTPYLHILVFFIPFTSSFLPLPQFHFLSSVSHLIINFLPDVLISVPFLFFHCPFLFDVHNYPLQLLLIPLLLSPFCLSPSPFLLSLSPFFSVCRFCSPPSLHEGVCSLCDKPHTQIVQCKCFEAP